MSLLRIEEELSYSHSLINSCPNITHGGGGISLLLIDEELSYSMSAEARSPKSKVQSPWRRRYISVAHTCPPTITHGGGGI